MGRGLQQPPWPGRWVVLLSGVTCAPVAVLEWSYGKASDCPCAVLGEVQLSTRVLAGGAESQQCLLLMRLGLGVRVRALSSTPASQCIASNTNWVNKDLAGKSQG